MTTIPPELLARAERAGLVADADGTRARWLAPGGNLCAHGREGGRWWAWLRDAGWEPRDDEVGALAACLDAMGVPR